MTTKKKILYSNIIIQLLFIFEICCAQRNIASLGKKLKNPFKSSASKSSSEGEKYVVLEEEEDTDTDLILENDHLVHQKGLKNVDLAFEDILITLDDKKKKTKRLLLDGSIRGCAKQGRMLAVMGPSGAGKSTLVHAMAGRVKDNKKVKVYGRRYINGEEITGDSQIPSAFIEQEVNFFPYMTVRETIEFRVALKFGSVFKKKSERDKIVTDLMKQMNLLKSADTIVGNGKVRGISGGERKRLSIAVELISSPPIIFLDEPTSGLDSAAAAALIENLRKLADEGKTIVAVIHQPSQHVFEKFDDLLLLSQGKQVYYGEVKSVRSYMESNACRASKETGTAEHILDCISEVAMEGESEEDAHDRIAKLAGLAADQKSDIGIPFDNENNNETKKKKILKRYKIDSRGGPKANVFVQLKLLLVRSLRDAFRGKGALFIKAFQQLTVGIIYGGIYSLGTNQASIQDRFGLLSLIAIGAANISVASTIRTFPKEKTIVSNELASKMYRSLPYFFGKAISELPLVTFFNSLLGVSVYRLAGLSTQPGKFRNFLALLSLHGLAAQSLGLMLGAVSPSSDVALALFPAVLILNIIFDGRNISQENTPKALRWVSQVGLIRWGFEGMCLNEFEGLEFSSSGPPRGPIAKTGKEALSRLGIVDTTLNDVFKAQVKLTGACWVLSFLGMTLTRQKFAVMKPPNGK